jgi:phosphoglycerol transferase MdoB-like AlkP superfamily enzyme
MKNAYFYAFILMAFLAALKWTGYIGWSWLWVIAPVLAVFALQVFALICFLCACGLVFIAVLMQSSKSAEKEKEE